MAHQVGALQNVLRSNGYPLMSQAVRAIPISRDTAHLAMKDLPSVFPNNLLNDVKSEDAVEARKQSIKRCIESLIHASRCDDQGCVQPSCIKMKKVLAHQKICDRNINGECPICKQMFVLCRYHAKDCNEDKCVVAFCSNIKPKPIIKKRMGHVFCAPKGPINMRFPITAPFPRMFNSTTHIAPAFRRPVPFMNNPFVSTIPSRFGVRRPPPVICHGAKPYNMIFRFDEFVQQQPRPYIGIDPGMKITNNATAKDWHKSISSDTRNRFIDKLVQTLFPSSDSMVMPHRQMPMIVFVKKFEGDAFEKADSKSEYYHLMAKEAVKIKKELEETRKSNPKNSIQIPDVHLDSKF